MVKGISRQVIVLDAPETQLFEQAIFILKDEVLRSGGVTDEVLMKEAKRLIRESNSFGGNKLRWGTLWGCCGAAAMGLVWWLSVLI